MHEFAMHESRLYSKLEKSTNLFFSLSTYHNNYLVSENIQNVISFYEQFKNSNDLIHWMSNRPRGIARLYEIDGDKEIIVVVTTADVKGKFATNCKNNVFTGLHIIFVESGGKDDFLFNIAHNINTGLKRALEYNPKWIFFSSDDVYKIDSVQKLKKELEKINQERYNFVAITPSSYHSQTTVIAKKIKPSYFIYMILKYRALGLSRLRIEKKFRAEYSRFPTTGIFRMFGKFFLKTKLYNILTCKYILMVIAG